MPADRATKIQNVFRKSSNSKFEHQEHLSIEKEKRFIFIQLRSATD
jgi:hypothetical protein